MQISLQQRYTVRQTVFSAGHYDQCLLSDFLFSRWDSESVISQWKYTLALEAQWVIICYYMEACLDIVFNSTILIRWRPWSFSFTFMGKSSTLPPAWGENKEVKISCIFLLCSKVKISSRFLGTKIVNSRQVIYMCSHFGVRSSWHLGFFALLIIALYVLRRWYCKKKKRNAEKMARALRLPHRALEYHPSKSPRRLEEGADDEEWGCRGAQRKTAGRRQLCPLGPSRTVRTPLWTTSTHPTPTRRSLTTKTLKSCRESFSLK